MALVLVLGVLALISAWATASVREDDMSLHRMHNLQSSTRAMLAAESALELSRIVLREDAKANNIDSLEDDWAQPTPPFPVDEGTVSGKVIDANRYFNLNDLVGTQGKAQPEAVALARRLFRLLGLDPLLVDALVDWMDADDKPFGAGGAEDMAYLDRPYRVKNAPLDRIEEVLWIIGFDHEILNKLRTAAIVRPSRGITPININTAPKVVLQSLAPDIPQADVEQILMMREQNPFAQVAELTSQNQFAAWSGKVNIARLSTASDAFIVRVTARFDRTVWSEEVMLQRTGTSLTTVYRQRIPGSL